MNSAPRIANYESALSPVALIDIYQKDKNIAIWRRNLEDRVLKFSQELCSAPRALQIRVSGKPLAIKQNLVNDLPKIAHKSFFIDDVMLLTDMFSELLGLHQVGLRLAVLTKAMCPKFHVDRVTARMVTTYSGDGTQWVENCHVKREGIGRVEVNSKAPINTIGCGEVALLKGDSWEGNEGAGLVHRSPAAAVDFPRLVLTLDCL